MAGTAVAACAGLMPVHAVVATTRADDDAIDLCRKARLLLGIQSTLSPLAAYRQLAELLEETETPANGPPLENENAAIGHRAVVSIAMGRKREGIIAIELSMYE